MHACALVGSMEASVSSSSAEELPDQLSVLATSALTMKWYSAVTCMVTAAASATWWPHRRTVGSHGSSSRNTLLDLSFRRQPAKLARELWH